MSTFDQRKEGFEKKFAHDADLKFKAESRRNHLAAAWAAEKLGLSGAEAKTYAAALVKEDLKVAGDAPVFARIRADFDAKGVQQSDHQIRRTLDELLAQAVEEIETKG